MRIVRIISVLFFALATSVKAQEPVSKHHSSELSDQGVSRIAYTNTALTYAPSSLHFQDTTYKITPSERPIHNLSKLSYSRRFLENRNSKFETKIFQLNWQRNLISLGGEFGPVLDENEDHAEFGNAFASISRPLFAQDQFLALPFGEIQFGDVSFARAGVDLILTGDRTPSLLNQRNQKGAGTNLVKKPSAFGSSFFLGGDITLRDAQTRASMHQGQPLARLRTRARIGFLSSFTRGEIFYGWSYFSKEFENQSSGQALSSINIHFKF